MNTISKLERTPKLQEERILDGRATKYGKTVIERDFKMPNGKVHSILCIGTSGIVPVVVFPFTDRGTVFILNQFRFGTNDWRYELPGGCPKMGQTWEEATQQELLEEVGAEAETLEALGTTIALNPALEDNSVVSVLARGCKLVKPQDLDATEEAEVLEIEISRLKEMLMSGEITDAKTVAISYLALDRLGLLS